MDYIDFNNHKYTGFKDKSQMRHPSKLTFRDSSENQQNYMCQEYQWLLFLALQIDIFLAEGLQLEGLHFYFCL